MKLLTSLKSKNLSNKTCLLRVDFNIEEGEIINKNPRFLNAVNTIKFLNNHGAKVVVLSHRGRPKITTNYKLQTTNYSLKSFAKALSNTLKKPVHFAGLNDKNFREKIRNSKSESVFLLENLRFFPGEDKNDKNFAKKIATLGDFYVNDAFAFSHRKTASMAAITDFLPSYAGPNLEKEIKNLSSVLKNYKKPLIVILGGVKISTKLGLIKNFFSKADYFLIGSAMADNFLVAQGLPIGDSVYEKEMVPFAKKLLKQAKIVLPTDLVINNRKILDIGKKTEKHFADIIKYAKTIIWNGPVGRFEIPKFAKGTQTIIEAILKNKNAKVVIGGGETIAAISKYQSVISKNKNIFVSTGGGAMLEYLSAKKLPGLIALHNTNNTNR
ncbi:MAG: phosphoglycerate kinase [Candidatus Wolfebacteria bacterium]|nr:phosphoglycerate kinase [Candidatus Wolfebacteria bacterium]